MRKNMKLYVVMIGEDSDQYILRIFKDEEKAINFCKYQDGSYYKEFETADKGYQMQKNGYYRCHIICGITVNAEGIKTKVEDIWYELISESEYETCVADKGKTVNVSHDEFSARRTYHVVILTHLRESDVSKDEIDNVLRKIGSDTCSEVAALFAEGYNLKKVKEIYKR